VPDAEPHSTEDNEPPFQLGDRVRVLDGPFTDFAGLVRAVDGESQRLTVTVEIFNRDTPLTLDFTQASRLERDAE
jgi:transcriptional antiterminator NusG